MQLSWDVEKREVSFKIAGSRDFKCTAINHITSDEIIKENMRFLHAICAFYKMLAGQLNIAADLVSGNICYHFRLPALVCITGNRSPEELQ